MARPTRLERFWSFVQPDFLTGCWEWQGNLDRKGYGNFHWGPGKRNGSIKAHRAAWYLLVTGGEELDPDEETLDHLWCGNTSCVRPMHMEPCTRAENTRRRYDEIILPSWADEHGEF